MGVGGKCANLIAWPFLALEIMRLTACDPLASREARRVLSNGTTCCWCIVREQQVPGIVIAPTPPPTNGPPDSRLAGMPADEQFLPLLLGLRIIYLVPGTVQDLVLLL